MWILRGLINVESAQKTTPQRKFTAISVCFSHTNMPLNLYIVTWPDAEEDNWAWDIVVSFVVACRTVEEARNTHPGKDVNAGWKTKDRHDTWIDYESRDELEVEHLGRARKGMTPSVVHSYFKHG